MALDPFWGNLFRRRTKDEDEIYTILHQVPLFQELSRREIGKLESILHHRVFAPNESIVQEGELGAGMYIVISGQVEITQQGEEGNIQHLATFGPGDFFGEQALLDESPRTASAIAVTTCQAVGFFRPDLLELIDSNPHLGLKIVMRLSHMISVRLRQTNYLLKEVRDKQRQTEREAAKAQQEQSEEPSSESVAQSS
jgi:CRP-like cAMP-binding protein